MLRARSTSPWARARSALAMVTRNSSDVPENSWMASCKTFAASCCKDEVKIRLFQNIQQITLEMKTVS